MELITKLSGLTTSSAVGDYVVRRLKAITYTIRVAHVLILKLSHKQKIVKILEICPDAELLMSSLN